VASCLVERHLPRLSVEEIRGALVRVKVAAAVLDAEGTLSRNEDLT
jgi:hypothetical protein